jgi:hypothetical protein
MTQPRNTSIGNHLYNDNAGIIHACESGDIGGYTKVKLVWTICGKDVPAGMSFISNEAFNCQNCKEAGARATLKSKYALDESQIEWLKNNKDGRWHEAIEAAEAYTLDERVKP